MKTFMKSVVMRLSILIEYTWVWISLLLIRIAVIFAMIGYDRTQHRDVADDVEYIKAHLPQAHCLKVWRTS